MVSFATVSLIDGEGRMCGKAGQGRVGGGKNSCWDTLGATMMQTMPHWWATESMRTNPGPHRQIGAIVPVVTLEGW